jgi:hypothetical protein
MFVALNTSGITSKFGTVIVNLLNLLHTEIMGTLAVCFHTGSLINVINLFVCFYGSMALWTFGAFSVS